MPVVIRWLFFKLFFLSSLKPNTGEPRVGCKGARIPSAIPSGILPTHPSKHPNPEQPHVVTSLMGRGRKAPGFWCQHFKLTLYTGLPEKICFPYCKIKEITFITAFNCIQPIAYEFKAKQDQNITGKLYCYHCRFAAFSLLFF